MTQLTQGRSMFAARVLSIVTLALFLVVPAGAASYAELERSITSARDSGSDSELFRLLLQRGEQYRAAGFLRDAQPDLREVVDISIATGNTDMQALAKSALGQLYGSPVGNAASIGNWPDAEPLLLESLTLAAQNGDSALNALVHARHGEWLQRTGKYQQAQQSYVSSVSFARETNNTPLHTMALIGMARTQSSLKNYTDAIDSLEAALKVADGLEVESRVQAHLAITDIAQSLPETLLGAQNVWTQALQNNEAIVDQLSPGRLLATHYGEMGRWFERNENNSAALDYTELAITTAADAHDLAFDWEWRLGRLFEIEGDQLGAINAYRRAARHVEAIRQDIPVTYSEGRSSFRETLAPIFLRLADLLMQQADAESESGEIQSLLIESQNIVERLKSSELQDYFRNVCVVNQTQALSDDALTETAVLYPIILPDRLALLVKVKSGYYHVSVNVSSAQIDATVETLIEELLDPRRPRRYQKDSKQLYDWLIAPVQDLLEQADVKTLFFVPDGALRRVPIAALWDGEQHLVEKYAIASAPGLTLLNAEPFSAVEPTTLLAGVSNPGLVLDEVDPAIVAAFVDGWQERKSRGLLVKRKLKTRTAAPVVNDPNIDERLEAFRLPAVQDEVESLATEVPSTVLLDEDFTLERFKSEITNGSNRIVHIASHGYFGGTAEDSWLMAHDKLLDMNELAQLFKPKEFAEEPIELLILSACQTAEGNDRAPLGLSGVALTSGARSVLGTLWVVADEATSELMQTFYQKLGKSDNTKADALREAQLATMARDEFSHPFFWAPFILIGSWL